MKRAEGYLLKLDGQMYSHRCGLAAVLSALLPGLGQIYAEQLGKGIAMIAAWVIGGFFYGRWIVESVSTRPSLYSWTDSWGRSDPGFWHFAIGLVFVGVWIYAIVDAACAPERM